MSFSIIYDNIGYLMIGAWSNGVFNGLIGGLALTLILSIVSGTLAGLIGFGVGTLMIMGNNATKNLLIAATGFFRAIPILMLMLWSVFLLPKLFGISVPPLWAAITALSLVGGAYIAHVVAAGLTSINEGQWSAGLALGFTRYQILSYFILPQAIPRMMPSFINQWVSLIKDTSLVYILSMPDFLYLSRQIDGTSYGNYSVEVYLFAGFVYYCLCVGFSVFMNRLTKRYFASGLNHAQ